MIGPDSMSPERANEGVDEVDYYVATHTKDRIKEERFIGQIDIALSKLQKVKNMIANEGKPRRTVYGDAWAQDIEITQAIEVLNKALSIHNER